MKKEYLKSSNSIEDDTLFRYQVISFVFSREALGDLRVEAVKKASQMIYYAASGKAQRVSTRSIYRWLRGYQKQGLEGLATCPRSRTGSSMVLSRNLLDYFQQKKEEDPKASIPELIKQAVLVGLIKNRQAVSRTTVWRAMNRMGINTNRGRIHKNVYSRRFAYPHRLDMVLCDGKHFRAGAKHSKRVVLNFIDDATRMILGVIVGYSESTELFLKGLYQVIRFHGLMDRVYTDHGSGFYSGDSKRVLSKLGIGLIYGEIAYPEGHGKVEKFNQTMLQSCLRYYDGNPEIDPTPSALQNRLNHYTQEIYNQDIHESLGRRSPHECFRKDPKPLKFPEDEHQLKQCFVLIESRVVSKDNVIRFKGKQWEVPAGHARDAVQVYRNLLTRQVSIIHENHLVELFEVDLTKNALEKRGKRTLPEEPNPTTPVSGSAEIAFKKEMKSMVDRNGNYYPKENES